MSEMEAYQIRVLYDKFNTESRINEERRIELLNVQNSMNALRFRLQQNPHDTEARAQYRGLQSRYSMLESNYKRGVARAEALRTRITKEETEFNQKRARSLSKAQKLGMRGFNWEDDGKRRM